MKFVATCHEGNAQEHLVTLGGAMVISPVNINEQTKMKHAAKGQKHAVAPEFLFLLFSIRLNFNDLLVACIGKFQLFG